MTQIKLPFPQQDDENDKQLNLFHSLLDTLHTHHINAHQKRCHHHRDGIRARIEEVFINPIKFHTEHRTHKPTHLKGLKLKKRLSLVQELGLFCMAGIGMWGFSHVALNQSAFTQIAAFKANTMKASLLEASQHMNPYKMTPEEIETQLNKKTEDTTEVDENKLTKVKEINRREHIKPKDNAAKVFEQMALLPSDNRVVIERIGKDVPLVSVPNHQNWNQLEEFIQKGLQNGAVVHPISREPGTFGNFFVTGHSSYYKWDKGRYKDMFALLHEVKEGDIVKVYWEGREYRYKLYEKRVIDPTETSVLNQPNNHSIITLMTCTPIGTNKKRLILVGELIE
jgi:LPXTG-site transpeptidase (sortase) family protein